MGPFLSLVFPMNWPYCQCGSLKMVSPKQTAGVWGVISWNGLRPAGMQLNGTNAQKEWQAPASGPLGGGLGAGMSFFKALRT